MNLDELIPGSKVPYGNYILDEIVDYLDENKINFLLEKGVNPNIPIKLPNINPGFNWRYNTKPIGRLFAVKTNHNETQVFRIINNLINHGAKLDEHYIIEAREIGIPQETINSWKENAEGFTPLKI